MADLSAAVADQLAARRQALGMTLEEVGARAGMHRTSVGLVERHERSLTLDSARRICEALGVRLSDVIRAAESSVGVSTSDARPASPSP